MGKDSGTKCSHCGKNGHNSRTCCEKTMKLFGVKISQNKREDPIKKSFSMGNLQAIIAEHGDNGDLDRGYLSDGGPVRSKKDGHERKKGIPWTIEEHKTFLKGLEKLGKGDWRGISRNFVSTTTPTQVASHAQKYFLRKTAASKKKRRASLFDMSIKERVQGEKSETHQPPVTVNETNNIPNQTGTSLQVANQVASHAILAPPTMPMAPASTALPKATSQTIPNFNGIPYMVGGTPGYGGDFSAVSVVPVVNLCSVGYAFQQKQQNKFSACAPFVAQQSHINAFSAAAGAHCARKVEPHHNLSSVNTDLKLTIAPPDTGGRSELPPYTSVTNGAIGVI